MKKILILFFFICTSIAFAKYEDVYNVKIESVERKGFKSCQYYEMITENSSKKYSPCELMKFTFASNKETQKIFEEMPNIYSKNYTIENIYEHKILNVSGYFLFKYKDPISKDKNGYVYVGCFWYTTSITSLSFSNYEEAQKFLKYLDVNDLLENAPQKMYARLLLQKIYEDKFLSSLKK